MINTTIIPAATASATTQNVLVEITERMCRKFCAVSSIQPSATVAFSAGQVETVGSVAVVPIIARITIVTPSSKECGCMASTQVFTERFSLGFTATSTNTVTLTPGAAPLVEPADVKCCKAGAVKVATSLSVTIA